MSGGASRAIGSTRLKLASVLVRAFGEIGVVARFDPKDLHPAQGHWRTDFRADVYRWQGFGEQQLSDGSWFSLSVDSWDTMTDCVRWGCTVRRDQGVAYDADANKSRTHPILLRAAARTQKASS